MTSASIEMSRGGGNWQIGSVCFQVENYAQWEYNRPPALGLMGLGWFSMKFNYPMLPSNTCTCKHMTTVILFIQNKQTHKATFSDPCSCILQLILLCLNAASSSSPRKASFEWMNHCLPFGSNSTWIMFPITDVLCSDWTATLADFTFSKTTLAIPKCFLFFGLYRISTSSISPYFLHMSVRNPSLMLSFSRANVTSFGGTGPT